MTPDVRSALRTLRDNLDAMRPHLFGDPPRLEAYTLTIRWMDDHLADPRYQNPLGARFRARLADDHEEQR